LTPTWTPTPTITPTSPPATSTPLDAGPRIGYFGIYRADGCPLGCPGFGCCNGTPTPTPHFENGIQVFTVLDPRAGKIVVEGFPNPTKAATAIATQLVPEPNSPNRPDLQIQANRPIGNGSTTVCDQGPAPVGGGVPAIPTPDFTQGDQVITNTLQDFACRFSVFTTGEGACTKDVFGNNNNVIPPPTPKGILQFCDTPDTTESFQSGDTLLTVRLRNVAGELGPTAQIIVRVGPTPTPTP